MLIPKLIHYAFSVIKQQGFDESHGLSHAMNVLHHSHNILQSELPRNLYLERHRNIVYSAAILHDLCDKKYMNEKGGIQSINNFLKADATLTSMEIEVVTDIIETMSYSKVKLQGYPDFGAYQLAYHIVREADLLAAYDFDRSLIYNMQKLDDEFLRTLANSQDLFRTRVLRHNDHDLFITEYAKELSRTLEQSSRERMDTWGQIL